MYQPELARKARKDKGYKVTDVAKFLTCSPKTIYTFECGHSVLSSSKLKKLEDLYNLPKDALSTAPLTPGQLRSVQSGKRHFEALTASNSVVAVPPIKTSITVADPPVPEDREQIKKITKALLDVGIDPIKAIDVAFRLVGHDAP